MGKKFDPKEIGKEKKQTRHKRWYKAVCSMAAVVVVCTVYTLMLPALTLDQESADNAGVTVSDNTAAETTTTADSSTADNSSTETTGAAETPSADSTAPADSTTTGNAATDSAADTTTGTAETTIDTENTAQPDGTTTNPADTENTTGVIKGESNSADEITPEDTNNESNDNTSDSGTTADTADEEKPDTTADVETKADWIASVHDAISADNWNDMTWAEKLLAVAETQLGYHESTLNYTVDNDGNHKGYTRYGEWYGDKYGDWCAMFVSFCLNYAGIDQEAIPQNANCADWVKNLDKMGIYEDADLYVPEAGDVVFFDQSDADRPNHVGIISEVTYGTKTVTRHITSDGSAVESSVTNALKYINAVTSDDASGDELQTEEVQVPVAESIKVIEGNSSDQVQYVDYDLSNEKILGYVSLTNAKKVFDGEDSDNAGDVKSLQYKGSDYLIEVKYDADAAIPEGTRLKVKELEEGSDDYNDYYGRTVDKLIEDSSASDEDELNITFARFFDLKFVTTEKEEIEPASPVSIKINYTNPVEIGGNQTAKVVHFAKEEASADTADEEGKSVPADTALVSVDEEAKTSDTGNTSAAQTEVPEIIQPDVTSNTTFEFEQSSFSVTATVITSANYSQLAGGQQYVIYTDDNKALSHTDDELGVTALTESPKDSNEYNDTDFSSDVLWTYEVSSTVGYGSFYYKDSDKTKHYLTLTKDNVTISKTESDLTVSEGKISATVSYKSGKYTYTYTYTIYINDNSVSAQPNSGTDFNFAAIKEKYVVPEQVKPTLTHEKYIKQIKLGKEYELTLTVSANKAAGDEKAKVDVVFVLDNSDSMSKTVSNKVKLTAANEALASLVNSISEDLDARYALVTFSGSGSKPYSDAIIRSTWSDSKEFIDSLPTTTNKGTNYQAGLMKAEELLKDARSDAQKIVVFISDGNPTSCYNDNGYSGAPDTNHTDTYMAPAKAILKKWTQLNYFFAVGVGSESDYSKLKALLDSIPTGVNLGLALNDYYFEGSSESAITKAIEAIKKNIQYVDVENVVVTDTLSKYAELIDSSAKPVITVTDKDGKTVTGAICNEGVLYINGTKIATAEISSDGKKITMKFIDENINRLTDEQKRVVRYEYKYAVTVEIKPTDFAVNIYATNGMNYGTMVGDKGTDAIGNTTSSEKPGFYSNDKATVTYNFTSDKITQTENYKHPVIQVVYQGYELPETGGEGTGVLYLLGAMLVTVSLTVVFVRRRRQEKVES